MASRRTGRTLEMALALSLAALPACNPYQNFDGEYFAGAIDATTFAAPYLGELSGPPDQSGGVIAASTGWVGGSEVLFYVFPFNDAQNGQSDPLALAEVPTPKAFVFDPAQGDPFGTPKCVAPKNYVHDQRTEAWRLDEQGVVFESTPSDPDYIPVVAQVPVASNGIKCQDTKSKKNLYERKDVTFDKESDGDGKFAAFAMVDPGADVQPNLANGLGPIHIGWYNHYLVTFLDGGYIPTEDVPGTDMTDPYTKMVAQTIYTPTAIPGMDDDMNVVPVPGSLGSGYDLLDAARGEAGYSPVCHVLAYTPDDPLTPKTSVGELSQTELASAASADADLGYVFCLQPF